MKNVQKIIDLTHTLSSDIPHWDDSCCFQLDIETDYGDCTPPNLFRTQKINIKSGSGTHMDAPKHCFAEGKTIDLLDLKDLVTDCIVIHIDRADSKYIAMPKEVHAFEKEYGTIPDNAFVIFHTGWSKHWNNPAQYRNDLKFPSIHEETATLLLKRNIAGIGIDTLSPDAGGKDFPVHRILLGAGKYIVENVANAERVPATGAEIMIMPMKIKDGTEAPIRMVAVVFS